jgi:hypothetical protein
VSAPSRAVVLYRGWGDEHAPAAATVPIEPVDLEANPRPAQRPMQLGPGPRREYDATRRPVVDVVHREDLGPAVHDNGKAPEPGRGEQVGALVGRDADQPGPHPDVGRRGRAHRRSRPGIGPRSLRSSRSRRIPARRRRVPSTSTTARAHASATIIMAMTPPGPTSILLCSPTDSIRHCELAGTRAEGPAFHTAPAAPTSRM